MQNLLMDCSFLSFYSCSVLVWHIFNNIQFSVGKKAFALLCSTNALLAKETKKPTKWCSSKPFLAKKNHRVPLPSPPHPTFPPSQSDPRPGTEGTGLPSTAHGSGSGDSRSRGPCRALQLLQGCTPPPPKHTPLAQHTPRADGESTHSSPREKWGDGDCDSSELNSPFPSLFSTSSSSSSPLQAMSCTCDTTDSLMLHYPYTSLSLCASLEAMFPDVASKLGHEYDTRRHGKGWRWYKTVQNIHFVHCFLFISSIIKLITTCAAAVLELHQYVRHIIWLNIECHPKL